MSSYTDYHVCARVTFDTVDGRTKLVNRFPLANSGEMAKRKCQNDIYNEYGIQYIKSIEFVHCLRLGD